MGWAIARTIIQTQCRKFNEIRFKKKMSKLTDFYLGEGTDTEAGSLRRFGDLQTMH